MKYPKINTLWKRDEKNKFNIMPGKFSKEEFSSISEWHITEKIDGTNIRVMYDVGLPGEDSKVLFGGRTDDAQIPTFLLDYLQKTFTLLKMLDSFKDAKKVVLYGEGYGQKIQAVGKKYRDDNAFILFDAWIDGWWLEPKNVKEIAKGLGVEYVPELGIRNNREIISLVRGTFPSSLAKQELGAEGIVARSHPLMLFRDGTPIMWKLKVKDYQRLNTQNQNKMDKE